MKKTLFVGSLLLLTTGLGLKPIVAQTFAKQVVSQTQPSVTPASQPKVELLSAGAQPQQVLRFKPAVNTIETATITLNTAMEMSIPGMPAPRSTKLPSTLMKMETVVTQVDPNGDIHYKFRYTDADMKGDASIPAGVLNTARAQVKKIVGLNGSFVMDDRGHTKSMSLTIPKSVDAMTRQMLEQSFRSLDQLSVPLPEVAVGVGAQWKTLMPVKIYGMMLNQTETYELVSLKDGAATLKVSVDQQAQGQKLTIPGMPKGANVTLKSLNTTGQGESKVRFDRLMPSISTLSMTSSAQMQLPNPRTSAVTTIATKTQIEMMLQSK
ncbi:hypothetical protein C7B65_06690 [Phormidesmis priestleyi ULC007]|uniref:Uncharacterized protein n=1 Tax=Phormidesmis priestleyi ULC007 TaxID=1920490 RepID=A0A2T1DJF3_9CYAN|nr:DUF6263 family protein [Phormidesmis priestleyi]PSB20585.1 hypothetical protein C7B65_06690 [Phormidesmis priestleyi ULC007]PZO54255.1 MAG: hypothetical protein DCF14_02335 [Phormidesmis priestleyi]